MSSRRRAVQIYVTFTFTCSHCYYYCCCDLMLAILVDIVTRRTTSCPACWQVRTHHSHADSTSLAAGQTTGLVQTGSNNFQCFATQQPYVLTRSFNYSIPVVICAHPLTTCCPSATCELFHRRVVSNTLLL